MLNRKISTLQEVRRAYILKVLGEAGWDYGKASKVLRVSEDYLRREAKRIAPDAEKHEKKGQGRPSE